MAFQDNYLDRCKAASLRSRLLSPGGVIHLSSRYLTTGPPDARVRLLCAHGAGAGVRTQFLEAITALLVERGVAVLRFEFSYMARRGETGSKGRIPKAESLVDEYRAVVSAAASGAPLLIGGKSMGGRVASLVADELHAAGRVAGLVCLGYPFHPPSRPDQLRTAHLRGLSCPALIVQGERDPFGTRDEVEALSLSPVIRYHWAPDGDHDLAPRRSSGHTRQTNMVAAADAIAAFAKLAVG